MGSGVGWVGLELTSSFWLSFWKDLFLASNCRISLLFEIFCPGVYFLYRATTMISRMVHHHSVLIRIVHLNHFCSRATVVDDLISTPSTQARVPIGFELSAVSFYRIWYKMGIYHSCKRFLHCIWVDKLGFFLVVFNRTIFAPFPTVRNWVP